MMPANPPADPLPEPAEEAAPMADAVGSCIAAAGGEVLNSSHIFGVCAPGKNEIHLI